MSGQLIDKRYRVLRKIGEGGMAVVHLAFDERLRRDVAIKILKDRFENHAEIRSRFQHEAQAILMLDHPNILKFYDHSDTESKQLWIVTELVHGRNVAQILETTPSGWLHPAIAASITREICRALTFAHDKGIVHRDVKPENVMITQTGNVKLMDFGIAKMQLQSSMTQTGMFMGSPSYMSPEQIRGRDIDHRSDIYSLGVMFYELLTGRLPFTGSSTADVAMKILSGEYSHPKYLMSGLPQELNDCVTSCMQLAPESRPQSIADVGMLLDQFLEQAGLDSSDQELQRCFRDPLAYGERLSRVLRVTSANARQTVLVDDLLPPKAPMHSPRQRQNPESIAKNLPERRHRQRPTEMTSAAVAAQTQIIPPRPQQKSAPVAKPQQQPVIYQEVRKVSRTRPPLPRRKVHHRHYIVAERHVSHSDNSFIGAFVAAVVILFVVGLVWHSQKRPTATSTKAPVSTAQKITKKPAQTSAKIDVLPEPKPETKIDAKPDTRPDKPQLIAKDKAPKEPKNPAKTGKTIAEKPSSSPRDKSPASKKQPANGASATTALNPVTPSASNPVRPVSDSEGDNTDTTEPSPQSVVIPAAKPGEKNPDKRPDKPMERPAPSISEQPAAKVKIAVSSMPAAELYINGRRGGTTNDLGTSSDWISVPPGTHRVELRRAGYQTRTETVVVGGDAKQKFGPYSLQRADSAAPGRFAAYRLTLSTNTPPVTVSVINIETRTSQTLTMTQSVQTLNLERGIYEVTMSKGAENKRRRIDLTGSSQQLTFSVEFKNVQQPQEPPKE